MAQNIATIKHIYKAVNNWVKRPLAVLGCRKDQDGLKYVALLNKLF